MLFCCCDAFVEKEILIKGYIFLFFSILLGSILLRNSQLVKPYQLTIPVFIFVIFLFFSVIITNFNIIAIIFLTGILFLLAYFRNNHISDRLIKVTIICLCLLQAGYGLLQYFHLVHTSSRFPIIGSFDNPAGFASCLAVALPLSFPLIKYSRYYRLLALFSFIIILIMATAFIKLKINILYHKSFTNIAFSFSMISALISKILFHSSLNSGILSILKSSEP